jgi:hypothetical protein
MYNPSECAQMQQAAKNANCPCAPHSTGAAFAQGYMGMGDAKMLNIVAGMYSHPAAVIGITPMQ